MLAGDDGSLNGIQSGTDSTKVVGWARVRERLADFNTAVGGNQQFADADLKLDSVRVSVVQCEFSPEGWDEGSGSERGEVASRKRADAPDIAAVAMVQVQVIGVGNGFPEDTDEGRASTARRGTAGWALD